MPNLIYNSFKNDIMSGSINLNSDTINILLVDDSYIPDQDTHSKRSNITGEITGDNYTAGGKTLTNSGVVLDNTADTRSNV